MPAGRGYVSSSPWRVNEIPRTSQPLEVLAAIVYSKHFPTVSQKKRRPLHRTTSPPLVAVERMLLRLDNLSGLTGFWAHLTSHQPTNLPPVTPSQKDQGDFLWNEPPWKLTASWLLGNEWLEDDFLFGMAWNRPLEIDAWKIITLCLKIDPLEKESC